MIALGFTSLLGRIRNAKLQIFPVVLCLLLVAGSGTSVWQAGNYVKVQNNQKVPDEVAQVAEVILNRRSSEDALTVADNHMAFRQWKTPV